MTRVKDITAAIEEFAPLSYQESYDNSGLIIGDRDREVRGIIIGVDVTKELIAEALECGANMIITHHPLIFNPLKRLTSQGYVEQCVELAIKNDIIIYACHTNLDSTKDGMSWRLAAMLGVENLTLLQPTGSAEGVGFGVVGELPEAMEHENMMELLKNRLNIKIIRHSKLIARSIKRVAICTGSGGSLIGAAIASGADFYVTADLKYNDFMLPNGELTVADVGHFESEFCAIDILYDILSKKMFTFAVRRSEQSINPVYYWGCTK